jgi:hypothetical protein
MRFRLSTFRNLGQREATDQSLKVHPVKLEHDVFCKAQEIAI